MRICRLIQKKRSKKTQANIYNTRKCPIATTTTSLYITEIKETHSEVDDIQNNKRENSCQGGCRCQEISVPRDQQMISDIVASALFADLRLQTAPVVGGRSASWVCGMQPPDPLWYLFHLTGKPELSHNCRSGARPAF